MATVTAELAACFPALGPIAEYVAWRAPLTHAPPVLHLAAILPVVAYEAARRGYTVPAGFGQPIEWFAVVAPPASAKSTQLREARAFSDDFYAAVSNHADLTPRPWVSLEGSIPGVIQRIAQIRPTLEGRTCGILYHTEFSRVLANEEAAPPLNLLYDGEDYVRNLRYVQRAAELGGFTGTQGSTIKETVFSASVTTTPSALERAMHAETLEGGLFSRFLWLRERLDANALMPRPLVNHEGRARCLNAWVHWFAGLEGLQATGVSREIRCTPEAIALHEGPLFEALRADMAGEGFAAGVALRTLGHAMRLAAIYALARLHTERDAVTVTYDDLWRAANFAMRSRRDALALGQSLAAVSLPIDGQTRQLVDMVEAAGVRGASRRDVYRLFGGKLPKPAIDSVIDGALDQELVVQSMGTVNGRGGGFRLYAPDAYEEMIRALAAGGSTDMQ